VADATPLKRIIADRGELLAKVVENRRASA
jgi:hypothetical protein